MIKHVWNINISGLRGKVTLWLAAKGKALCDWIRHSSITLCVKYLFRHDLWLHWGTSHEARHGLCCNSCAVQACTACPCSILKLYWSWDLACLFSWGFLIYVHKCTPRKQNYYNLLASLIVSYKFCKSCVCGNCKEISEWNHHHPKVFKNNFRTRGGARCIPSFTCCNSFLFEATSDALHSAVSAEWNHTTMMCSAENDSTLSTPRHCREVLAICQIKDFLFLFFFLAWLINGWHVSICPSW